MPNISEINRLAQTFAEFASFDCEMAINSTFELSNSDMTDDKKDESEKGISLAVATANNNNVNEKKDNNDKNVGESTKIEMLKSVINHCSIELCCLGSLNDKKNNPLHYYVLNCESCFSEYSSLMDKNWKIKMECSAVKLLKNECNDWLYQLNGKNELPLAIAVKLRKDHLMESILFDTKNQEQKREDEEEEEEENGRDFVRNEKLFKMLIENEEWCKEGMNWIIESCVNILKPFLHYKNKKNERKKKRIAIVLAEMDSTEVKNRVLSKNRNISELMKAIETVVNCYDFRSMKYNKNFFDLCRKNDLLYVIEFLREYFNMELDQNQQTTVN